MELLVAVHRLAFYSRADKFLPKMAGMSFCKLSINHERYKFLGSSIRAISIEVANIKLIDCRSASIEMQAS